MRRLYHVALDPHCRKIRLGLAEKGVDVDLVSERVWERRPAFLAINPAGEVPVFAENGADDSGPFICGHGVITEYLEDVFGGGRLWPAGPKEKAEARRLADWFDRKFHAEVTDYLLTEKLWKRFMVKDVPNGEAIRAGRLNLRPHLEYLTYLLEDRHWLAGRDLTWADLSAGAQLSSLDYLAEVPWADFPIVKDWYARLKSRPSFRDLLADTQPGLAAPMHYADLDF